MRRCVRAASFFLSVVVSAAAVVAVPTVAQAAPAVDQDVPHSGSYNVVSVADWPSAQTFTAGVNGGMTKVDLRGMGSALSVEVRPTTSTGAPDDAVLATGTMAAVNGWTSVVLSEPVPVAAGTTYAIIFDGDGRIGAVPGNPYAGGSLWSDDDPWGVYPDAPGWDLAFRTYVDDELDQVPSITGTPTTAALDETYTYAFDLEGWPDPEVTLDSGELPDGITLSAAGVLSGTPTESGDFTFTVAGDNVFGADTHDVTLQVTEAVSISGTPTDAVVDEPYDFDLRVVGHPVPDVTVDDAAHLPPGLTVSSSGVISGTPTAAGDYDFTVIAENGTDDDSLDLSIRVDEGAAISGSAPDGEVGEPYDFTFATEGDPAPEVALVDGDLPDGLALTAAGRLHGTPTVAAVGAHAFTVEADNGIGDADELDVDLVVGLEPSITGSGSTVRVGEGYHGPLAVDGFPTPVLSVTSGALPDGLTLDSSGGITGSTTVAGTYDITVTATNDLGSDSVDLTLTILPQWQEAGEKVAGDGQSVQVGDAFAPLRLLVTDGYGNPVPGVEVQFARTGGDAEFPGGAGRSVVATGTDGVAESPVLTAGTTTGTVTVDASVEEGGYDLMAISEPLTWVATFTLEITAPAESGTPPPGDDPAGDTNGDPIGDPVGPQAGDGDDTAGRGAPTLAETGGEVLRAAALSVLLVLTGAAVLRVTRRRTHALR